jgi:hypothetical protein
MEKRVLGPSINDFDSAFFAWGLGIPLIEGVKKDMEKSKKLFFPQHYIPLCSGTELASSDDDFDSDDAGGEEQELMLKAVKFPEVESANKIPNLAPKVAKCIQKRSKNLSELIGKFTSGSPSLSDTQATFLSPFSKRCRR